MECTTSPHAINDLLAHLGQCLILWMDEVSLSQAAQEEEEKMRVIFEYLSFWTKHDETTTCFWKITSVCVETYPCRSTSSYSFRYYCVAALFLASKSEQRYFITSSVQKRWSHWICCYVVWNFQGLRARAAARRRRKNTNAKEAFVCPLGLVADHFDWSLKEKETVGLQESSTWLLDAKTAHWSLG